MNPFLKQLFITASIYAALIGSIFLFNWMSPGDNGHPSGAAPFVVLGIPIISGIILCKSIFRMANNCLESLIPLFASVTSFVYLAH